MRGTLPVPHAGTVLRAIGEGDIEQLRVDLEGEGGEIGGEECRGVHHEGVVLVGFERMSETITDVEIDGHIW